MSGRGCKRCGNCCLAGGPALHGEDLALIRAGELRLDELITIRVGELALAPLADRPEPVRHEFLKLQGQSGTWCCSFYNEQAKGCGRYPKRPLACRLLDCTDTGPLLAVAGQDLLTRFDCMAQDDPLLPLVREHEARCACPDLAAVRRGLADAAARPALVAELEAAVSRDLSFRTRAASEHNLSVARELFSFGRPLFQLLLPLGLEPVHTPKGIGLRLLSR